MQPRTPCTECGQLQGIPEYNAELWDIYYHLDDGGRKHIEPFVYTQDDLEELGFYDDEDTQQAVMDSMTRNMQERGLCGTCGRPDLRGIDPSRIMSDEDAQESAEYYAQVAAERRAGC